MRSRLDAIFKKKVVEILLALKEKPMCVRELHERIGGNVGTVLRRLDELVEAGIIVEERSQEFPFKRVFALTVRGKNIVGLIAFIKEFLEV